MPTEFEAKFINVDVRKIREKLVNIGANIVHESMKMVRTAYFLCDQNKKGYFRIRDELGKIFMTVKDYSKNLDFPEEYEVSIDQDFQTARQFANAIGLKEKAYQESYREKWQHPLAHEICLDTIPGIPIYLEIDSTSKENLEKLIKLLNMNTQDMRFGAFDRLYEEYYGIPREIINNKTKSLTFKNILKEIHPTKNEDLLKKIYQQQKNLSRNR
jgi:adenylate cyclase class IV